MSYTYGAAASNDITWATGVLAGAASSAFLVCGWWRPTTITAGRGLWSFGNTGICARWSTIANQIDLVTNNVTTDGVWNTTTANFVAGNWYFMACLYQTSTATTNITFWSGTGSNTPIKFALTNTTAPVGNNTASTAVFYLGNIGTSTTAGFQGQIGSCNLFQLSGNSVPNNPFLISNFTSLSADEENYIYTEFVIPSWLGVKFPTACQNISFSSLTPPTWQACYFDMEASGGNLIINRFGDTLNALTSTVGTNTGGVFSYERPPFVAPQNNYIRR